MDLTIFPKKLNGVITAIPSKSMAHRYLICSAFSDCPTELFCPATSRDIEATAECLRRLGAIINLSDDGYHITPIKEPLDHAILPCGESGSTLRFLLPIVGALGIDAEFTMDHRLSQRPLAPLLQEMSRMGCRTQWITPTTLLCQGQLHCGNYRIPGNISSQFISGLLFACSLLNGESSIAIHSRLESQPYVSMTLSALSHFGINATLSHIEGTQFISPRRLHIEGDWSSSSCFFTANALGSSVQVQGLANDSLQGDSAILSFLQQIHSGNPIDVADVPDLVPILAVAAAAKGGAVLCHTGRLRAKESDRVKSVLSMLLSLGIHAVADNDTITISPGQFHAGTVDSYKDHRIAMAAAIAATCADGPVTIVNAQCVEKSYPNFWEDYRQLGGSYEQHIR